MSKSVNKNFRQNLVNRVTKTNGPKMANRGRAILLRDESYQGLIKIRGDFPFKKNLLDFRLNRITNIPLEPLEEGNMNTIRPWSFEGFHGKQGMRDFQIKGRET